MAIIVDFHFLEKRAKKGEDRENPFFTKKE